MARPLRRKLKFDEESVNKLLQEVYDDAFNIKAKIARLFTKWETKIKEGGEIAAIGDQVIKLIAAEAKNQDQKIMLLKYLKEVVFDNKNPNNIDVTTKSNENDGTISSEKKSELMNYVREEVERAEREKNNK